MQISAARITRCGTYLFFLLLRRYAEFYFFMRASLSLTSLRFRGSLYTD